MNTISASGIPNVKAAPSLHNNQIRMKNKIAAKSVGEDVLAALKSLEKRPPKPHLVPPPPKKPVGPPPKFWPESLRRPPLEARPAKVSPSFAANAYKASVLVEGQEVVPAEDAYKVSIGG
jgi:hypothetical protein